MYGTQQCNTNVEQLIRNLNEDAIGETKNDENFIYDVFL